MKSPLLTPCAVHLWKEDLFTKGQKFILKRTFNGASEILERAFWATLGRDCQSKAIVVPKGRGKSIPGLNSNYDTTGVTLAVFSDSL